MKVGSERASVHSSLADASFASLSIGLVSPCSKCKNYRAESDDTYPGCPRRRWQARADELKNNPDGSPLPPDYLLRKARDPNASGFENPVNIPEAKARLVWIATLEENEPIFNADNTQANPDLLDPTFDTNYIKCRPLPYIPMMREADGYNGGQLVEGNWVALQSVKIPQYNRQTLMVPTPVQIGGFCQRITPLQYFVIAPASSSVNGQGK